MKYAKEDIPPKDSSIVYIYRQTTLTGALRSIEIDMNGKKLADLSGGSFTQITVTPGAYEFNAHVNLWPGDLEFLGRPNILTITTEAGRVYYLGFYPSSFIGTSEKLSIFDKVSATKENSFQGILIEYKNIFGLVKPPIAVQHIQGLAFKAAESN